MVTPSKFFVTQAFLRWHYPNQVYGSKVLPSSQPVTQAPRCLFSCNFIIYLRILKSNGFLHNATELTLSTTLSQQKSQNQKACPPTLKIMKYKYPIQPAPIRTTVCTVDLEMPNFFAVSRTVALVWIINFATSTALSSI